MILVADDDVSFLELARDVLNRDRQVFVAFDAHQAFLLAKNLGFSVALVDLDMKGKDGLLLIQKLRENFPQLPVIAISTALTSKERDAAKDLGVVDLLQKPAKPAWKSVVARYRSQNL